MHHIPAHRAGGLGSPTSSVEKELGFVTEPMIDLQTGRRVALELLARPRSGLGFEHWTGASFPQLAASVTRMALRRYGAMGPQGIPVHVNITGLDLERPEFALEVRAAMAPACHRSLVLEVTEQYPVLDSHGTRSTIERLRELGVRFALDDAFEGWNNFRTLRILAPDVVKVTRRMLGGDRPDEPLARWVVDTARSLPGTTTVLEQIETAEHLRWARAMGFDVGQGYWWTESRLAAG